MIRDELNRLGCNTEFSWTLWDAEIQEDGSGPEKKMILIQDDTFSSSITVN